MGCLEDGCAVVVCESEQSAMMEVDYGVFCTISNKMF